MSLLMDALKRAEREREAQASKEGEGEDSEQRAPRELALDPMEQAAPEPDEIPPQRWSLLDEAEDDSGSFSFDLDEPRGPRLGLEGADPVEDKRTLRAGPSALEGFEDLDFMAEPDAAEPLEDTGSTMPSMKAVRASVDRYFDGSHSSSLSLSIPLESDEATTVVQQRETAAARERAAAQTVFEAKRRPRRAAGAWVWLAAIPIVLLLFAGGGYYYWLEATGQKPDPRALVSLVTGGSDPVAARAIASVPSIEPQPAPLAEVERGASEEAGVEPPASGDLTPVEPEPEPVEVVETPPPVAAEPEPTQEELLAAADQQIAEMLGGQRLIPEGALRSQINISRRPMGNPLDGKVLSAYEAFQRSNLDEAEHTYREVVAAQPTNRDAILGLAAIAMRRGRPLVAYELYAEVLRLNPRDSVAQSALLALRGGLAKGAESESQLKLLLEREPEAHYLHFSLGNLYAAQQRWAEAQEAYFSAHRLDRQNADYAFNLAIGLDHLAQGEAALKFYKLALELADGRPAAFEQAGAVRRITSISGASAAP